MGVFKTFANKHGLCVEHGKKLFSSGKLAPDALHLRVDHRAARTRDLVKRAELVAGAAVTFKKAAAIQGTNPDIRALYLRHAYALRFQASESYLKAAKLDKAHAWSHAQKSREQRFYAMRDCPGHPDAIADARALAKELVEDAQKSLDSPISNENGQTLKGKFSALLDASLLYKSAFDILSLFPPLLSNGYLEHAAAYEDVLATMASDTYRDFFAKKADRMDFAHERTLALGKLEAIRAQSRQPESEPAAARETGA